MIFLSLILSALFGIFCGSILFEAVRMVFGDALSFVVSVGLAGVVGYNIPNWLKALM